MAEAEQPVLSVVRGTPDDAELAALTAVVSAVAAAKARAASSGYRPQWSRPRAMLRVPIAHGPGAWHASGLPG